jgi:hypothetical protein
MIALIENRWAKPRVRIWRNKFDRTFWSISTRRINSAGLEVCTSGGTSISEAYKNLQLLAMAKT